MTGDRSGRRRAKLIYAFLLLLILFLSNGRVMGQIDAIPASLLPVALLVDGSVTSTNLKDELAPKMARLAEPMRVGSLGQPIKLDLRRAHGAGPIQLHNAFEMPAGGSQTMIIRRPVPPESIFEQRQLSRCPLRRTGGSGMRHADVT